MKRLFIASCVLLLSGCQPDVTSDEAVDYIDTADSAATDDTNDGNVWESPRRLKSIHMDDAMATALRTEVIGEHMSMTLIVRNDGLDVLNVSPDATVYSREGDEIGVVAYDKEGVRLSADEETSLNMDLSALGLDEPDKQQEYGLFYTLNVQVDDTTIPLDFYIGDAVDLIAATPDWYDDLSDDMDADADQALVDWITRHE